MRKLNTEEFLQNLFTRYPDNLGLDLTKFEYVTARTKSIVRCIKHDFEFLNTANNMMQGIKRCHQCKSDNISELNGYTITDFLNKSQQKHGDYYDYSKSIWVDSRTPISIICKVHGEFSQNPQSHWNGYGCPHCGYKTLRKSLSTFMQEAADIHYDRYTYENTVYKNNYTPVTITCKKHGPFSMSPVAHLFNQRGCPTCYPGNRSWPEINWLDELSVPQDCRQKRIRINGKSFLVDANVENTVYEFWGDFWHGNPVKFSPSDKNTKCNKTFGELYERTMNKRSMIQNAGYTLIESNKI